MGKREMFSSIKRSNRSSSQTWTDVTLKLTHTEKLQAHTHTQTSDVIPLSSVLVNPLGSFSPTHPLTLHSHPVPSLYSLPVSLFASCDALRIGMEPLFMGYKSLITQRNEEQGEPTRHEEEPFLREDRVHDKKRCFQEN